MIETLTPEATLSPLTDQNEPAEQNQVPFNFEEDSEVATVDENPEAETALNNATDSIPPTDADDDLFEFDIPDHFESTDNTERYDSNETSGGTETSETADDFGKTEESDLGEAFDHTDDLTDGDTVEESDERAPTSPQTISTTKRILPAPLILKTTRSLIFQKLLTLRTILIPQTTSTLQKRRAMTMNSPLQICRKV